jgi:putative transposase
MVKYDPDKHHRRSIRLKDYDYAQAGAYFVTVCTHNRECLFGEIIDAEMRLSEYGQIVVASWQDIPRHFDCVELDAFVVMPNHLHGNLTIIDDVGAKHFSAELPPKNASPLQPHGTQSNSLGAILQNFKSVSTRKINQARDTQGAPVWQRNYHEHIVRNEREWNAIREYVANNPANWLKDSENPGKS